MQVTARMSLIDPEVRANPYPFYHRLRETAPVCYEPPLGGWLLTRYDDVSMYMGDPRLINPRPVGPRSSTGAAMHRDAPLIQRLRRYVDPAQMLFANPPKHGRLRGAFAAAFTSRALEGFRRDLDTIADDCIAAIAGKDRVDFAKEFARPLMATSVSRLIGVPDADRDQVAGLVSAMYGPVLGGVGETLAKDLPAPRDAAGGLADYFAGLIAQRRRRPADDTVSALVAATDGQRRMAEEEIVSNIALLFLTALSKTAYYLTNALLALLHNPDQLQDLRDHPEIAGSAADELLRYDSPVQVALPQVCAEQFDIRGSRIDVGDVVYLVLGAANRDPARFPDPDRLDLRRPTGQHVGFGVGLHNCLGGVLARMHGQQILPRLVRGFPQIRLDLEAPAPEYGPLPFVRALAALHVRLQKS